MPDLQAMANSVADQFGIPQDIFRSLINKETGGTWNPNLVGGAGEYGLTQLLPSTAAMLGVTNPFDPLQNLQGGATYLAQQYKTFGNWQSALAAYNGGPGGVNLPQAQAYATSVLANAGVSGANSPGIQSSPPTTSSVIPTGGPSTTPTPSAPTSTWTYIIAIVIVLILLIFGVWGVMKG